MAYVTTRKELQEAVKRKDPKIVVSGKLAKKIKGFAKLKKLSKMELAAAVAFLTGSGAAAAAAIAAAVPTGGLSIPAATAMFLAAAPAAGVSMGTALILIALIGAIGLTTISLLKDYDVKFKVGNIIEFDAKK